MGTSEATPGPWRTEPCDHFDYILSADDIVASTWGAPHNANARLIAAAPDLLAALKRILIEAGEGSVKGRAIDLLDRWTIELARAAIARAEGKS